MKAENSFRTKWPLWTLTILAAAAVLILLQPFIGDLIRSKQSAETHEVSGNWPVLLEDRAGLLTEAEERDLRTIMDLISVWCPVAMETTTDTGGKSTAEYAELRFKALFPQKNGILFLIDMDHRVIQLQRANTNTRLSKSDCLTITDNVYQKASRGDYFSCAANAFLQVYAIMKGQKIPQPMKHLSNLFLSFGISLFAVFLLATGSSGVIRPNRVYNFGPGIERKIDFKNVNKRFVRYIVTSDSDSSGGSSSGSSGRSTGGGFSGGGFSGGGGSSSGGGHRF